MRVLSGSGLNRARNAPKQLLRKYVQKAVLCQHTREAMCRARMECSDLLEEYNHPSWPAISDLPDLRAKLLDANRNPG